MLVTDFDYDLPKELIAQHPMEPRDHSVFWLLIKILVISNINISTIW